jgi:hypothetical protein
VGFVFRGDLLDIYAYLGRIGFGGGEESANDLIPVRTSRRRRVD